MLVEGIDDQVLILCTVFSVAIIASMFSFFKNLLRPSQQVNPTIHQESLEEVNFIRQEQNLNPTAPPAEDETHSRTYTNINCPICLGDCLLPVETNCGHIFCGNCIIQYWNQAHVNIYSKMKCPMCRQEVSVLLPLYTLHEQEQNNQEHRATFDSIKMYNKRFSGAPRPWLDYLTDIPIILRHVFNELLSMNSLDLWDRLRFIFLICFMIFYFLVPLDLIPEVVFGVFGLLDDLLVAFWIVIYICSFFRVIISNRR